MKHRIIGALIIIAMYAVSWGVNVGFVKLITLCFGWNFSLLTATGIWLILYMIKLAFSSKKESK